MCADVLQRGKDGPCNIEIINVILTFTIGRIRTVVSISHCGCDDPGSIPGFDIPFAILFDAEGLGAVVLVYFMAGNAIGCSCLEYCVCDV